MSGIDTDGQVFGADHEGPLMDRAQEVAARVRQRLQPVDEFIGAQVKERPLVVLGVAVGLGYLAGRLIRRI